MKRHLIISACVALTTAFASSAMAAVHPHHDRDASRYDQQPVSNGEWRLDPRRCADVREDRRDQRYTYSRRDRREDRRDERWIDCPASAWVWVESRDSYGHSYRYGQDRRGGYDRFAPPLRPAYRGIYCRSDGAVYARHDGRDIRLSVIIR